MPTTRQLVIAQRRHVDLAELDLNKRQQKIVRRALRHLKADLWGLGLPGWNARTRARAMSLISSTLLRSSTRQTKDLQLGLSEVMKRSGKDAGLWLATHDRHFLDTATPLRFDTIGWWTRHENRLGKVRLRRYRKSFNRYGRAAVIKIEEELGSRILLGEPWEKARDRVWEATRDVVGDRRWMVDRIVRTEVSAAYNGTMLAALHEEDSEEDPMRKVLVATWDQATGKDSMLLDGQSRPLGEPFFDAYYGISYQAPPNRPNDREIIAGWRTSWGPAPDMSDPPRRTKKMKRSKRMAKTKAPAKRRRESAEVLQERVRRLGVQRAVREGELARLRLSMVPDHRVAGDAATVAVMRRHNEGVSARVAAMETEIAGLRQREAGLRSRARLARRGASVPQERAPAPRSIRGLPTG